MSECGYILEETDISIQEGGPRQPPAASLDEAVGGPCPPEESIIEWFDRAVEAELGRHRASPGGVGAALEVSPGVGHHIMMEGAAGGLEAAANLGAAPDTELSEAVEKFAIAESIIAFEGAVRAAEEAAAQAPPELAEEAAVAGAKGFQAELTSVIDDDLFCKEGCPIEVIGYVGITKPANPKLSKPKSI